MLESISCDAELDKEITFGKKPVIELDIAGLLPAIELFGKEDLKIGENDVFIPEHIGGAGKPDGRSARGLVKEANGRAFDRISDETRELARRPSRVFLKMVISGQHKAVEKPQTTPRDKAVREPPQAVFFCIK